MGEADQDIVHRALAYAAKLLTEAGVSVIVDATAPRRIWREAARTLIPCFAEVLLLGPADVCVERERAAHWGLAAARDVGDSARGPAPNIVLDYEESFRPDWTVRTDLHDAWSAAQHILILVSA